MLEVPVPLAFWVTLTEKVDGFEKLVQAGVSAVVQPSGSINDKEVIKFANATGTVLIFSKTRHFRH